MNRSPDLSRVARPLVTLLAIATVGAVAPAAVRAESLATSASSAGSSASSAGSASLRGSSDSLNSSSDSSKDDEPKVTQGEYRVREVAQAGGAADALTLHLDRIGAGDAQDTIRLDVPRRAVGDDVPRAGEIVTARNQPFGVEFQRGEPRRAFFLVVADRVEQDVLTRPVTMSR